MITIVQFEPSFTLLQHWSKHYVPSFDIFFLNKTDLVPYLPYLKEVLIIPESEFNNHSSYQQIQSICSFEYWQINKDADTVLIASSSWLEQLPFLLRKQLLSLQRLYNRGLIFPLAYFESYPMSEEFIDSDFVVIQSKMWREFPLTVQLSVLEKYAHEWDNWNGVIPPHDYPEHLRSVTNTFPELNGSNCLSAVLFALSKTEWIFHEWVHQHTFSTYLFNNDYQVKKTDCHQRGDVIVWTDQNQTIQHAAYCIGDHLYFILIKMDKHSLTLGN